MFIKLPLQIKLLICDLQKAESGNQLHKSNVHEVKGVTSADLAPGILPMEQNFYETEGADNVTPDVANTTDSIGDDQLLLAHLMHCRELPPHDIWQVLASQQSRQEQQGMQHSASFPKKSITIDGVVYTANVHNIIHSVSKHCVDKQETSLVDCRANGGMAGDDVMVVKRGECFATVNGIDRHTVQDLHICTVTALL